MVFANECAMRVQADIEHDIAEIDAIMMACIDRGLRSTGILPGGLDVRRRAKALARAPRCTTG